MFLREPLVVTMSHIHGHSRCRKINFFQLCKISCIIRKWTVLIAIKIGGSNYLRYMKHNTITWTVGVFSLIFFVLVKKLRHEVEVPSTAQSRLPLLDGAQTQSDYELAGDESCNQYSFSVEKRIISVTHCGLWPCRIYICISLALAWIQLYMFKWSVS